MSMHQMHALHQEATASDRATGQVNGQIVIPVSAQTQPNWSQFFTQHNAVTLLASHVRRRCVHGCIKEDTDAATCCRAAAHRMTQARSRTGAPPRDAAPRRHAARDGYALTSASTTKLVCARSCRAAGSGRSRGTPTRSRMYPSAAAAGPPSNAVAPPWLPPAARSASGPRCFASAPTSSACATCRSAAPAGAGAVSAAAAGAALPRDFYAACAGARRAVRSRLRTEAAQDMRGTTAWGGHDATHSPSLDFSFNISTDPGSGAHPRPPMACAPRPARRSGRPAAR